MAAIKKLFKTSSEKMSSPERQSPGIIDDYSVRKDIQTISLNTQIIQPKVDSTTAIQIKQASGSAMVDFNTLNARVGIGTTTNTTLGVLTLLSSSSDTPGQNLFLRFTDDGATKEFGFRQDSTNESLLIDRKYGGVWYNSLIIDRANSRVGINIGNNIPVNVLHISGGAIVINNFSEPATTANMGKIFVSGGALYFKGGSGTVTSLAVA